MAKYLLNVLLLGVVSCTSGCLSIQVRDRADSLATTTTDLLYQQVLDNLARICDDPDTLPYLDMPSSGTAQVQHELQAGYTPTFDLITAGAFVGRMILDHQSSTVSGSQTVNESWSIAPLSNPDRLLLMKGAYRRTLGIATKGDKAEEALAQYYRIRELSCQMYADNFKDVEANFANTLHAKRISEASKDGASNSTLSVSLVQKDGKVCRTSNSPLPFCIDYEPFSNPTGWFTIVHRKKDVPKTSRFVGRHGDTYVCVSQEHVRELANFTLAIMDIAYRISFYPPGHEAHGK